MEKSLLEMNIDPHRAWEPALTGFCVLHIEESPWRSNYKDLSNSVKLSFLIVGSVSYGHHLSGIGFPSALPPTLPSPQPASPITRTLILIHDPTAGSLTLPLVTTGSTLLKAGPCPGLCPSLADFPLFCVTLIRLAPSMSFLFPFAGQISLCSVYCVRHSHFSSSVLNQSRKQHTDLAHCGGENSGL